MKNVFALNCFIVAILVMFTLGLSGSCFSQSQGGRNCTSCSCGGSIIAGSCSSGQCCEPNVANCECNFYSSYCGCDKISSTSPISNINENNVRELISVLKTNQFTSTIANDLIRDLPLLIQYRSEQKPVEFYALAGQLDRITRQLPASEKQVLNNWIASKGGETVFE